MTLDDRLRGTYQRQLRQVEDRMAQSGAGASFQPSGPPLLPRLVMVGAFAAVAVIGVFGAIRLLDEPAVPLDAGDAGGSSEQESGETPDTDTEPLIIEAEPTTTTVAPMPAEDESPTQTAAEDELEPSPSATDAADTSAPTTLAESATTTTAAPETTIGEPAVHPGVPNEVCPSGARAQLEMATLRYVSEAQGWGRKDDLVDEQDGPYYFEAWEPNFGRPVSVEIALAQPVLATDVRVAQDPFAEVGGAISISADGDAEPEIAIDLAGVGDWKVHSFPEPTLVQTLVVTREIAASNIMEIMVCVAPTSSE